MSDPDPGDASDPSDDGSAPGDSDGPSGSGGDASAGDDGTDPASDGSDTDPSDGGDDGLDDDSSDGDGSWINPWEAAYIAENHVSDDPPPAVPARQAPFVARNAGISSDTPHDIDAVSHALPLAPALPSLPPLQLPNIAKDALDDAIGALPSAPPTVSSPCQENHWIEIVLVDQENQPIAGVAYKIVGPDGAIHAGTLDDTGLARVDGLPPGTCQVSFPDLEDADWDRQGLAPL
jgi:hypothetical protein